MGCDVAPRIVEYWLKKSLRMFIVAVTRRCVYAFLARTCTSTVTGKLYHMIGLYINIVCLFTSTLVSLQCWLLTIALHGVKYVHLLFRYLEPDVKTLLTEEMSADVASNKFEKLNEAIAGLVSTTYIYFRQLHFVLNARIYIRVVLCIMYLRICPVSPPYLLRVTSVSAPYHLRIFALCRLRFCFVSRPYLLRASRPSLLLCVTPVFASPCHVRLCSSVSRPYHVCRRQIDDYSLVKFMPLDITDEQSINDVLVFVDNSIQYGEDLEPKIPRVCSSRFTYRVLYNDSSVLLVYSYNYVAWVRDDGWWWWWCFVLRLGRRWRWRSTAEWRRYRLFRQRRWRRWRRRRLARCTPTHPSAHARCSATVCASVHVCGDTMRRVKVMYDASNWHHIEFSWTWSWTDHAVCIYWQWLNSCYVNQAV